MSASQLFSLSEVTVFYEAAKTAYLKALSAKEYEIKDRRLHNQSLNDLESKMVKWQRMKKQIECGISGGIKVRRGIV